jgi:hypothetical protein
MSASTPTKQAWTPGPWAIDDNDQYSILIVSPWSTTVRPEKDSGYGDYRGAHVCELHHQNSNPCVSKEHAEANARLISKAPEMAAALLQIFNDAGDCTCPQCTNIRKAERILREAGAL